MQSKTFYAIGEFQKTYYSGMNKKELKDLFNRNLTSYKCNLLFITKNKKESETYFKKIKVESKKLTHGETFRVYSLNKLTYNEEERNIKNESNIDLKLDEIIV